MNGPEKAETIESPAYVVRTGLYTEDAEGETRELVFCTSDSEGGWLAEVGSTHSRCQALVSEDDDAERWSCGAKPSRHKVITLAYAYARGLLDDERGSVIVYMLPLLIDQLGEAVIRKYFKTTPRLRKYFKTTPRRSAAR